MRNTKLISVLSRLLHGELAAVISFIFTFFIVRRSYNLNFRIIEYYVFFVLLFILLQGS